MNRYRSHTRRQSTWRIEIGRLRNAGISLREIAILVRTRKQLAIFETVFEQSDIPFEVADRRTLHDIPVLFWLVRLLKSCVNVRDGRAFLDCLGDERYGVVDPSVAKLVADAICGRSAACLPLDR